MDNTEQQNQVSKLTPEIAARNKRLAIILGLVALAFYAGFILMHMF